MNTYMKKLLAVSTLALLAHPPVLANDSHHKPAASVTSSATDMTDGEVRKIDLETGKITLRHAEIKSLDMPGMTMVFVVKDKAMLEKLKTGDKIKFKAINAAGQFTVTEIQPAR